MGSRRCPFQEANVKRFVHAVKAAGLPVYCVVIDMMHWTLMAITDKDAAKDAAKGSGKIMTEEELKKLI